jgi:hypothetical protein
MLVAGEKGENPPRDTRKNNRKIRCGSGGEKTYLLKLVFDFVRMRGLPPSVPSWTPVSCL